MKTARLVDRSLGILVISNRACLLKLLVRILNDSFNLELIQCLKVSALVNEVKDCVTINCYLEVVSVIT